MDYEEKMTLSGDNRKGARFGSAIATVGDLNKDGFQGLWSFMNLGIFVIKLKFILILSTKILIRILFK